VRNIHTGCKFAWKYWKCITHFIGLRIQHQQDLGSSKIQQTHLVSSLNTTTEPTKIATFCKKMSQAKYPKEQFKNVRRAIKTKGFELKTATVQVRAK
jgi:hypothetical protein